MKNLYERNSLVFWSEKEILLHNFYRDIITLELKECLISMNPAFQLVRCDAPSLIPNEFIHENYTKDDVYFQDVDDIALRPETTASSYLYAKELMNKHNDLTYRLPLVVYQHNKSFRKEQDKTLSNMRLKEFNHLEYQILYSSTTLNDYYSKILDCVNNIVNKYVDVSYIEESDRLPTYSEITMDIIIKKNNMEVCSISKRTDFPDDKVKVIEVAFSTDRLVYNKLV